MLKFILIALFVALIGFGIWFWNLTGPQQLDLADRWYPGSSQDASTAVTGISYGDDDRQKLDIYTPLKAARDGKRQKTLVFFHGGAWRDGEREGYAFLGKAFAARGLVTVIADYRKTPAVKFPAFVEDTASALAWVHKNISDHRGDPDQIYVAGHSAGAHISMMAALDRQWLGREGLDSDIIKGVIGLAGPYDFLPFDKGSSSQTALGDWPRAGETQPISYVRRDAPPLLLLTGDKDTVVKPRNSKRLAVAMQDIEGQATLKIYSGVDHADIVMAIARPFRRKAPVVDDILAFIESKR
ncbi:MAG: alpha/beta hydrolase [Sphingorhabdus sp.]